MKIDDNYEYIETELFKFEYLFITAFDGPRIFQHNDGYEAKDGSDDDAPDTMCVSTFRILHIDGVVSNLDKVCDGDFIDDWYWYASQSVKSYYGRDYIERGVFYKNAEELLTYYRAAAKDAGYSDLIDFMMSGKYFAEYGKKITKKMICDYLDAVADYPAAMKRKEKELNALLHAKPEMTVQDYNVQRREILNHYANPFPFIAKRRDEITIGLLIGVVENFLVRNGFRERGK